MRSRLLDILAALDTVYSGWIWWNLFLAFIPLVLSFVLFRKGAIAQRWLWWACGAVGFIGVLGFVPRYRHYIEAGKGWVRAALAGDGIALLALLALGTLSLIAIGAGAWLLQQPPALRKRLQPMFWWIGFVTYVAFLPNAPYLLTDIIHLIRGTSSGVVETWIVALVFIPLHVVAILMGFEAYVLSLLNQNYFLKQQGWALWILPAELAMHGLNAIGIYLGRFIRFNSWDLVADPSSVVVITLNTLTERRPLFVIFVTFVILTIFYWIMKQITLGLKLRLHYARHGLDVMGTDL
ncbi:DUF1361 domain-containing protein [Vacuolonema iberomarrocanum]|uniref:DUF1361 domain-containing protein n=1 Tax=Vacuolonema iberomarrocanum TaxID=3454632 RepID=UPI0019FE950A|nr:DUF1361 domain-containing protein [filamentous cyanobacterium LEGE 07170]